MPTSVVSAELQLLVWKTKTLKSAVRAWLVEATTARSGLRAITGEAPKLTLLAGQLCALPIVPLEGAEMMFNAAEHAVAQDAAAGDATYNFPLGPAATSAATPGETCALHAGDPSAVSTNRLGLVEGSVVPTAICRWPTVPGISAGDPLGCAAVDATWFFQRHSDTSASPSPVIALPGAPRLEGHCSPSTALATSCTSVVPPRSGGSSTGACAARLRVNL